MAFRQKLMNFMYGRRGNDGLNLALLILAFLFLGVNLFVHSTVIFIIEYLLLILVIFRGLSKNLYRRGRENEAFMKVWRPILRFFKQTKNRIRDRKTHVYRKCPGCKTVLRLPKIKGEHGVTCPKCSAHFDVKV